MIRTSVWVGGGGDRVKGIGVSCGAEFGGSRELRQGSTLPSGLTIEDAGECLLGLALVLGPLESRDKALQKSNIIMNQSSHSRSPQRFYLKPSIRFEFS